MCCSCSPVFYYLPLQKMTKSESGHDLVGKKMAVVSVDTTYFMTQYATSFAGFLKEDYGCEVECYHVESLPGENGSELKKQMIELALECGSDVLFYLPSVSQINSTGKVSFYGQTFVYDNFAEKDTTYTYSTVATFTTKVSPKQDTTEIARLARNFAEQCTSKFQPKVVTDYIPFAYHEDEVKWVTPLEEVAKMNLEDALKTWTAMLNTKNNADKAALELNIAAVLYIQGRYDLAKEWIDLSKATFVFEETEVLEKKIQVALKNK